MSKEVITKIANTILDGISRNTQSSLIAEAILNLTWDCTECEGSGNHGKSDPELCPTCKGNGKGKRMIGILAENQDLPFAPYYVDERIFLKIMEFITTPKDGTVWKKVEIE